MSKRKQKTQRMKRRVTPPVSPTARAAARELARLHCEMTRIQEGNYVAVNPPPGPMATEAEFMSLYHQWKTEHQAEIDQEEREIQAWVNAHWREFVVP